MRVKDAMVAQGLAPSSSSYDHLIQLWNTRGKGSEGIANCVKLYEEARRCGYSLAPGTLEAMIAVHGRRKDAVACKRVWGEMGGVRGDSHRASSYCTFICALASCGDINSAMMALKEMGERCKGDTEGLERVYASLVTAHGKRGDLQGAAKIFGEAIKNGISYMNELLDAMVAAYTTQGKVLDGKGEESLVDVLRRMELHNLANKILQTGRKGINIT